MAAAEANVVISNIKFLHATLSPGLFFSNNDIDSDTNS